MHTYCKLSFQNVGISKQEILIAQLLDLGFESFEQSHTTLFAYIPEKCFNEQQLRTTLNQPYKKETIAPQNWNEAWEKSFDPVIVNDFCCIRAAFHGAASNTKHDIIITPKMSFGTGHHATTWLMVTMMQHIPLLGKTVLDFGTGTGVLAILAEKCGAASIMAIDNDEWSIDNAKENIFSNTCTKISVHQADRLFMQERFDVVLANINKQVIMDQLDSITQHLQNDGVLILSGLLQSDKEEILKKIEETQLLHAEVKVKNEWIAIKCKRRNVFGMNYP